MKAYAVVVAICAGIVAASVLAVMGAVLPVTMLASAAVNIIVYFTIMIGTGRIR